MGSIMYNVVKGIVMCMLQLPKQQPASPHSPPEKHVSPLIQISPTFWATGSSSQETNQRQRQKSSW